MIAASPRSLAPRIGPRRQGALLDDDQLDRLGDLLDGIVTSTRLEESRPSSQARRSRHRVQIAGYGASSTSSQSAVMCD
jgi:hypothetical protein